ncbi:MAG: hypothetical protein ACI8RZ_005343 [Myxococcota bacterium]|jgi:hypothetical protein
MLALLGLTLTLTANADCEAGRFVYVVTARDELYRFHPPSMSFQLVSRLSCPARSYASPYSMAVSRDGTAYVVFNDGNLFRVDTETGQCDATGYRTNQAGFTSFGMGYMQDGSTEKLFISASSYLGGSGYQLGTIAPGQLKAVPVGVYDQLSARSELTGTGDGRLFGAFEGEPYVVAEIDPRNARILSQAPQDAVSYPPNSSNFAFAFWGGSFWLFAGPGSSTDVYRYNPDEGTTEKVSRQSFAVVGAGVSTCAPTEFPTDDSAYAPLNDRAGELTVGIEDVTPGPYTAGETITATAGLRDDGGTPRSMSGGTFHITDSNGNITDVRGEAGPDGRIRGALPLPAGEGISIRFTPDPMALADGERLISEISDSMNLDVARGCEYLAMVTTPAGGSILAGGAATTLTATLLDPTTRQSIAAPAGHSVAFSVRLPGRAPDTLPATGLSTTWTPPEVSGPLAVEVWATGEGVCRGDSARVTVSPVGLSISTDDLPDACYTDRPCVASFSIVRPADPAARQLADTMLASGRIVLLEDGREVAALRATADDRYSVRRDIAEAGERTWQISVQGPDRVITSAPHVVRFQQPLTLAVPELLDFGTIPAGTAALSSCQTLDLAGSQSVEGHRFALSMTGGTCLSEPALSIRGRRAKSLPQEAGPFDPAAPALEVCLKVPACSGEVAPGDAMLVITPLDPAFSGDVRSIPMSWNVEGRSWLACHAIWLIPTVLAGLSLLVLVGFVRPRRFDTDATITTAGDPKAIRRATPTRLRDCPGSRAGFYRNAALGVHGDGSVNGRVRHAAAVLRAVQGGVLLEARGGLEVYDRRRNQWKPVEDSPTHPSPRDIYRVGDLCFRVEGGD